MTSLRVNSQGNYGKLSLSLIGRFDESAKLGDYDFAQIESIHIDFDRVVMITSSGVRVWVQWVELAQKVNPELKFHFSNCPRFIVEQVNNIRGFLPANSRVDSFQVPYYCETCDKIQNSLYQVQAGGSCQVKPLLKPETCDKEECPKSMKIDVITAKYFAFISTQGDKSSIE